MRTPALVKNILSVLSRNDENLKLVHDMEEGL